MGEDLKTLMGDAYHDGITVEEIDTFVKGGKIVNLSSGKYVDKSKFDRIESELSGLKESTKDYDSIKAENEKYKAEKADESLKATLEKNGVNPEFFRYVKTDLAEKVFELGDDDAKNKDAVEKYLKAHPQFAKPSEPDKPERKIVTTKVESQNKTQPNGHSVFNDSIRKALGKKTLVD